MTESIPIPVAAEYEGNPGTFARWPESPLDLAENSIPEAARPLGHTGMEDLWAEKERQESGRGEARIQALLDGTPLSVRMYANGATGVNGANGREKPDEVKDGETAYDFSRFF